MNLSVLQGLTDKLHLNSEFICVAKVYIDKICDTILICKKSTLNSSLVHLNDIQLPQPHI
jgi:hypothetical protein